MKSLLIGVLGQRPERLCHCSATWRLPWPEVFVPMVVVPGEGHGHHWDH
jgi:hypothetical protein